MQQKPAQTQVAVAVASVAVAVPAPTILCFAPLSIVTATAGAVTHKPGAPAED